MSTDSEKRWLGPCYAVTIFVSAFLLFQVQPLISKYILPWFGGTPAVWTTCMLFFQMALFAGYTYAHVISRRLSPSSQAFTQMALIAVAIAVPIIPSASWKPTGDEQPTLQIVKLLAASVGLPFFILSSTGPLLQAWFSRTHPGKSPYRLYALSNFGSLLALLSYPVVFEPAFESSMQAKLWWWGFLAYAVGCSVCALAMRKSPASIEVPSNADESTQAAGGAPVGVGISSERPSIGQCLLWFALPMAASVMLLATTNQVCMDVASVPFLWVVPLSLYLLSFILCFDSDRWYSPWAFAIAMSGSMATVCKVLYMGVNAKISVQIFVYFSTLFFSAMFCHGELVRLKPHPRYLTMFYLFISAGGAAGGLFVGVVAPYAFSEFYELPIGMAMCLLLMCVVFWRQGFISLASGQSKRLEAWGPIVGSTVAVAGLSWLAWDYGRDALKSKNDVLSVSRNFYGVLRVKDVNAEYPEWHHLTLTHGRILHGVQFLSEDKRERPTTYYVENSGVGLAIRSLEEGKPKRVGIVGLGVGTLASYAEDGDVFRFYEINPRVLELAQTQFTYLGDAGKRAKAVEVELGDARLSMEREEPQKFDVLALDAFSSDAIPVHLLTVEAFEIFRKHLAPGGVLAVHISNRYFDLRPVVEGIADELGMKTEDISFSVPTLGEDGFDYVNETEESDSEWVLVAESDAPLSGDLIQDAASSPKEKRIVWTDTRNNLLSVMLDDPPQVELWNWIKAKWRELTEPKKSEEAADGEESDTE